MATAVAPVCFANSYSEASVLALWLSWCLEARRGFILASRWSVGLSGRAEEAWLAHRICRLYPCIAQTPANLCIKF